MVKGLIECNKDIKFGQPALISRRLSVYDIVTKLYYEDGINIALEDYQITIPEAKAAVEYCKSLSCQRDLDLVYFCDGCLLRTLQEGWNFEKNNYVEIKNKNDKKLTISKDGEEIFFGSIEELENSEFGKVTWLIAEEVYNKYLQVI